MGNSGCCSSTIISYCLILLLHLFRVHLILLLLGDLSLAILTILCSSILLMCSFHYFFLCFRYSIYLLHITLSFSPFLVIHSAWSFRRSSFRWILNVFVFCLYLVLSRSFKSWLVWLLNYLFALLFLQINRLYIMSFWSVLFRYYQAFCCLAGYPHIHFLSVNFERVQLSM